SQVGLGDLVGAEGARKVLPLLLCHYPEPPVSVLFVHCYRQHEAEKAVPRVRPPDTWGSRNGSKAFRFSGYPARICIQSDPRSRLCPKRVQAGKRRSWKRATSFSSIVRASRRI